MPDFKPNGLQFAAQLMIPKAQHLDSFGREKLIARFISGALIGKAVTAAVQFHRQLDLHAMEIEKVNAAGILAAEFEIGKAPVTQQTPEAFLGTGGFFPEPAGEIARGGGASAVDTPHPNPLP